jgi:hypothetical protein
VCSAAPGPGPLPAGWPLVRRDRTDLAGPARSSRTPWPDLIDATNIRLTRVVLAAAHLDNDPANNRLANLRGLCQRCHMLHDRPFHLAQRWLTYRRRWAIGDLFFGRYGIRPPSPTLFATTHRLRVSQRGTDVRGPGRANPIRTGLNLPQLFV